MRILSVTNALAILGGIECVLSDKVIYLVQMYGYEVYVVISDQGENPIPFPLDERVDVKNWGVRFHQHYRFCRINRWLRYREFEKLI